jgi:hypothetical protein
VGSHVNSIVNSLNDSAQVNANTDATAVAEAQTGSNPISDIFQVYSGANFKIMFKGQADASFLGDAGNFAYGAISADLGVPLSATEAVAGIYAKVAGHTDTNHPFGMDSSANQQIPAGYQATCQK